MNPRKQEIIRLLTMNPKGLTASDVAEHLAIDRSNASRYLSELYKERQITKTAGRPVVYSISSEETGKVHVDASTEMSFEKLVGANDSLQISIQQAKAAILYPPRGLHTIIFGETGTGKSMFAECMYQFAISSRTLSAAAPFVSFNCADYAQNPQLLFGHIFGIKKGAYTGATEDSQGLIAKADGGILFLDEIHRLPPEGQEMLFTFIDKGVYRPLGESTKVYKASVQIIGATTESSTSFLTTFNRRIPMAITLPTLASRSLDERYEIISLFIKQESNRLCQRIEVEREAILAFMLYDAEANIGQVKRDLKLVCAKAFLHYRMHNEKSLVVRKKDLSLQVQKGLLKIKEIPKRLERFMGNKKQYLTFEPGFADVVWSQDPERDMQVYNTIEEKVTKLSQNTDGNIDLEALISRDVEAYFQTYVEELTQNEKHQELLPEDIWRLTSRLYGIAEERLKRNYNDKARFAFALHLQSTLERVKEGHMIVHPDLNNIRKNFKKEFQVALDLSAVIEEEQQVEIPFDEIGFISMFLSINSEKREQFKEHTVEVVVLMHGEQTATSMLALAQELLGTKVGTAFNMPLTLNIQDMYQEVIGFVKENKEQLSNGLLFLTDMGSLNTFGHLIFEETGIRTQVIPMTSSMVVIEAVRLASAGRSLEDIYQAIRSSFETLIKEQLKLHDQSVKLHKKAVIIACFTGEGVATKLYQRILPVINEKKVELIQMQFVEREAFKRHIDALLEEYEIKAIAGTVDVDYQNIPFFSAYDIFDDEKLNTLKRIVDDELPLEKIVYSLKDSLTAISDIKELIHSLQKIVQQIQIDLSFIVEPGVETGIAIHLAFMVNALLRKEGERIFNERTSFLKKYRLESDVIRTNLIPLERRYQMKIPEDEIAFVTQMFVANKIEK